MDDLLEAKDKVSISYTWHDSFTTSETHRIVRIESLVEEAAKSLEEADLAQFVRNYLKLLVAAISDPKVVALKSIICYRTGLDIEVTIKEKLETRGEDFLRYFVNGKRGGSWRLATKSLNDMMANLAIQIAGEFGKPIQFHTGLGDNDLRLVKANPAYMQNVIEAYPRAKIVLLHSSYPFTREAGYLATVYDNVYLDCVTPV